MENNIEIKDLDNRIHSAVKIATEDSLARTLKKRLDAIELVIMYAQDIVDLWPNTSLRTLYKITDKVASLREALKQAA